MEISEQIPVKPERTKLSLGLILIIILFLLIVFLGFLMTGINIYMLHSRGII